MPPGAPRNSPTGLASLPPLSDQALPLAPSTPLPSMASQPFPQMAAPVPSFMEAHQGMCLSPAEPPVPPAEGPLSAPPSICRSVHVQIEKRRIPKHNTFKCTVLNTVNSPAVAT